MAIASLIVKIGAADQEIQKALASVGEKARSVDADLKKLGNAPLAGSAQKSLESLRATMDQITTAQKNVADRATLAAQGIEAMGGAGRLTDTQLKAMNRTLQDGLSSFKALGQEAPKQLQEVADAVKGKLDQPIGAIQTKMLALGSAIGTFLGNAAGEAARALLEAGKASFVYADSLTNLSAATGVGVEALQDLEAIGVTSGVSMETLASSIEQLQKHLDDPKAVQAIHQMGLDYEHIRNLAPEDQFLEIAKAVAAIEDPVERANAGAALFGKTWSSIAPAIKGDIDAILKETTRLSKEQIKALDDAGDRWDTFVHDNKKRLAGFLGDLVLAAEKVRLTAPDIVNPFAAGLKLGAGFNAVGRDAEEKALNALPKIQGASPKALAIAEGFAPSADQAAAIADLNAQIAKSQAAAEKFKAVQDQLFGRATIDHVQELARALGGPENITKLTFDETKKLHDEVGRALDVYHALGRDVPPAIQAIFDKTKALQLITIGTGLGFAPTLGPPTIQGLSADQIVKQGALTKRQTIGDVGAAAAANIAQFQKAPDIVARSLTDDLASAVPNAIQAAIQGGGSKLQAAGSAIGSTLFGKDSNITKSITGLFSADGFLGKALKDTVPIIGSLIGPAIAGLQKLFGKSEESSKVSPLRDAFFKAAGGLDVLNPKVQQLTGNLTAVQDVFKAKTVDDYNAAIQRLNAVLGVQDQALAEVNAAVQKYGFSISELGPKFAQQKLNEQQGQVLKEWKLLNEVVKDQDNELTHMVGSFQDVVTAGIKSGATISDELRAPIQRLADMGLLVDENGNKLTDLSRLTFGSLDSEFTTLTKAINNLTRALGGAVDEAENVKDSIASIPDDKTISVHTRFDSENAPDSGGQTNIEGFATGTKGWRDFGSGTLAVLHGIEAVVPKGDVAALNATRAGSTPSSPSTGSATLPPVIIQITGPVLAATEYVEQHLAKPLLDAFARYHRAQFGRLVASTS